jgi:hypothetical protein
MTRSSKIRLDIPNGISRVPINTDMIHRRTTARDWKTETFVKPIISAWNLPLPLDQVSILLRGYRPQGRQDKWFVYADDELYEKSIATLHIFRSSTGFKMAEITIEMPTSTTSTNPPRITQIIWESDENIISGNNEERAKRAVRELYTWVLAKQTSIEEPMLAERPALTKTKSWRAGLGRLAEFNQAKQASPTPSPLNLCSDTWRIVDVPKLNIATRPAVFYCPDSP